MIFETLAIHFRDWDLSIIIVLK